jgi:hypothetical protein
MDEISGFSTFQLAFLLQMLSFFLGFFFFLFSARGISRWKPFSNFPNTHQNLLAGWMARRQHQRRRGERQRTEAKRKKNGEVYLF